MLPGNIKSIIFGQFPGEGEARGDDATWGRGGLCGKLVHLGPLDMLTKLKES